MERSTSQTRNLWIGLGLLAFIALVAFSWGSHFMAGPFGYGFHPFVGPWFFGAWGIGLLVRVLFFGLLLWLIFRVFRGGRGYRRGWYDSMHDSPSEILRRRYASGEINREQYEEMRRTLEPAA